MPGLSGGGSEFRFLRISPMIKSSPVSEVHQDTQSVASRVVRKLSFSPGSLTELSMVRASSNTTRCCSGLPGAPNGRPKGNRSTNPRGTDMASALVRSTMSTTVGMPAASMARAISPPD